MRSILSHAPRIKLRTRVTAIQLDLLISLALLLLALLLRRPYLHLIPRYTDEVGEAVLAMSIANGECFPLTSRESYYGVVHLGVMAVIFRLLGPSPLIPRDLAMVTGALTVVSTYWLGRLVKGRTVGALAGLFMATNFSHILINSHIGSPSCIVPLLTTALVSCLYAAIRKRSTWLLAISGFLGGLAMQLHPVSSALLLGMVIWFLMQPEGRAWLKEASPYLASLSFLLAYANMIWYNVRTGLGSLRAAADPRNAFVSQFTPLLYLNNLRNLLLQSAKMVSGTFLPGFRPEDYILQPEVMIFGVVLLAAMILVALRRQTSICVVGWTVSVLTIPLFTDALNALLDTRYLTFLLPLNFVALGTVFSSLFDQVRANVWWRWLLVFLLMTAMIYPLWGLANRYHRDVINRQTNYPVLRIAEQIRREQHPRLMTLYDKKLHKIDFGSGGNVGRSLAFLLRLSRVSYRPREMELLRWRLHTEGAAGRLVITTEANRVLLSNHFCLRALDIEPATAEAPRYGLYRVETAIGEQGTFNALKELPAGIRDTPGIIFDDRIQLLGFDLKPNRVVPGEGLELTLCWRALAPMETNYTVFTHLTDDEGHIWGQQDNPPRCNTYPTSHWQPGEIILDPFYIRVDENASPGTYTLMVGLYEAASGQRLTVHSATGRWMEEGNRVRLATLEVPRQ
ncbi:MAG: glycosyltransferase family 39 protein [Chloroflexota bacterium]|nr:glycosyltransferase family 39 protein [Chloroflexota bacterium]